MREASLKQMKGQYAPVVNKPENPSTGAPRREVDCLLREPPLLSNHKPPRPSPFSPPIHLLFSPNSFASFASFV